MPKITKPSLLTLIGFNRGAVRLKPRGDCPSVSPFLHYYLIQVPPFASTTSQHFLPGVTERKKVKQGLLGKLVASHVWIDSFLLGSQYITRSTLFSHQRRTTGLSVQ